MIKYEIINENRSRHQILIAPQSSECIEFCAKELQYFFKACTGVQIPILSEEFSVDKLLGSYIVIGGNINHCFNSSEWSKIEPDGFHIKSRGELICIAAKRDRGFLFGVYELIEQLLGVRFFAADCTKIPLVNTVSFSKLDVAQNPAFDMRIYLDGSFYADNLDMDFAARSRVNYSFAEFDQKHGGRSPMYGRGTDHNFRLYVPYEIYGERHPEFYVEPTENYYGLDRTVCISNGLTDDGQVDDSLSESVIKIAISEMKKDVAANPDIKYFVFEQEDGETYCKCEKCFHNEKRYTRTGMLIRFVNALAREVCDWAEQNLQREIKIVTFAYSYTVKPPVVVDGSARRLIDPSVAADDRVCMRMAFFGNMQYSYFSKKQLPEIREMFEDWKLVAKNFMIWAYDSDFAYYPRYVPSFNNVSENVKGFLDMGIKYLCVQGNHRSNKSWQSKMRAYVYHKIMWNPELNQNNLYDEFMDEYFNILKPDVKEFMKVYDDFFALRAVQNPDLKVVLFGNYRDFENTDLSVMEKTIEIIERAEQKINKLITDEALKLTLLERIKTVKLSSVFTIAINYEKYYPNATEDNRVAYVKFFIELMNDVGEKFYHDNPDHSLDALIQAGYRFPY